MQSLSFGANLAIPVNERRRGIRGDASLEYRGHGHRESGQRHRPHIPNGDPRKLLVREQLFQRAGNHSGHGPGMAGVFGPRSASSVVADEVVTFAAEECLGLVH